MPWAAGSYTKGNSGTGGWTGDASLGIGIEAGRHDTQDNDFATGINQCINKDGSNAFTGNPNLGGFIPTNLGAGTAAAPALCVGNDVNTGVFGPAADTWAVATNGVERVRVSSSGVFDVKTTGTQELVTINRYSNDGDLPILAFKKSRSASLDGNTIVQSGDSLGAIAFGGANGTGYNYAASIIAVVDGTPGASNDMPGRLEFRTTADGAGSTTERMRITSAGRVGIGTGTPTLVCEVNRNANDNATNLGVINSSSGSSAASIIYLGNDSGFTAQIIYNSSTNATNAGANGLTIYQGVAGGKIRIQAVSAGVELLAGATSWSVVSDSRLKKNVQPLSYGLAEIVALNPVRFDYNEDESDDSKRMGFVAQEVLPVIPEVVTGEENTFYGLSATELIPTMVNAIKELSAKVEALQARVAELEGA